MNTINKTPKIFETLVNCEILHIGKVHHYTDDKQNNKFYCDIIIKDLISNEEKSIAVSIKLLPSIIVHQQWNSVSKPSRSALSFFNDHKYFKQKIPVIQDQLQFNVSLASLIGTPYVYSNSNFNIIEQNNNKRKNAIINENIQKVLFLYNIHGNMTSSKFILLKYKDTSYLIPNNEFCRYFIYSEKFINNIFESNFEDIFTKNRLYDLNNNKITLYISFGISLTENDYRILAKSMFNQSDGKDPNSLRKIINSIAYTAKNNIAKNDINGFNVSCKNIPEFIKHLYVVGIPFQYNENNLFLVYQILDAKEQLTYKKIDIIKEKFDKRIAEEVESNAIDNSPNGRIFTHTNDNASLNRDKSGVKGTFNENHTIPIVTEMVFKNHTPKVCIKRKTEQEQHIKPHYKDKHIHGNIFSINEDSAPEQGVITKKIKVEIEPKETIEISERNKLLNQIIAYLKSKDYYINTIEINNKLWVIYKIKKNNYFFYLCCIKNSTTRIGLIYKKNREELLQAEISVLNQFIDKYFPEIEYIKIDNIDGHRFNLTNKTYINIFKELNK